MSIFKQEVDIAIKGYYEAINDINKLYKNVLNEDAIYGKSDSEIAQMIPKDFEIEDESKPVDYCDKNSFCDAAIEMLEKNIEHLYEQYIREEYNYNHIIVVGKTLTIAAVISILGYLPLTLGVTAISYVFLAKREMSEAIQNIKMHEWLMDSVVEYKDEIKSLEKIKLS
jgi:hypothetical protein